MHIVIDAHIPYIKGVAEAWGTVSYIPGHEITSEDVRHADALIVRTRTRCDRALLEDSAVKFIATATIGFDHLDTDYLATAGIAWTNAPGCNATSVAQYVANALLCLSLDGHIELSATTVGIVGVGNVGSAVATAVARLGCRLLLCDPPRADRGEAGFVPLSVLQETADVICLHTPLTHHGAHPTHHLLGETFFSHPLPRRPILVSAGRGEVLATAPLKAALREGKVRQAVIDVWEHEPHIDTDLLALTYIGTPHIAGYSANGKANGTRMALTAVANFFGLPTDFVIAPPALPDHFQYDERCPSSHPALQRYNPQTDSCRLKANPKDFEQLRSHYPLRVE